MKQEDAMKFVTGMVFPKVVKKEIEEGVKYSIKWSNGAKFKIQLDNDAPLSREITTFMDQFVKKPSKVTMPDEDIAW